MAHTVVRDVVIWTRHIHGGDVAQRLGALPGDAEVTLVVDGVSGRWCKMRNGRDGRPTFGLRPVGRAQAFWRTLFETRRGDSVSLDVEEGREFAPGSNRGDSGGLVRVSRTEAEREAALAEILEAAAKGWSSDGRRIRRDELYDR